MSDHDLIETRPVLRGSSTLYIAVCRCGAETPARPSPVQAQVAHERHWGIEMARAALEAGS